ncbi:MAG TPA: carboxypeptidase-like regulatory domain-containing protein [Thermoanaerobaculia bacterium]|jgi:hypothetical protein
MKRLLPLLALCLVSPVLRAAISGNVLALDGSPVAGARVTAHRPVPLLEERTQALAKTPRPELARATTNAEGAFVLDTNAAGMVELLVERDGFAPGLDYILAGDTTVVVQLTPAATRTGTVTANGKPVAGAAVIATTGHAVLWSTATGADGTYAVADPRSWGVEEVVIVHPDYAPATLDAKRGRYDVALVAGGSVAGTVTGRGGRPVANARVTAGPWTSATTGEDGKFVLRHVAEDVKNVAAFHGGAFGSAARAASPLAIALQDVHAIAGTVRDADKRPLPGAPVGAFSMKHGEAKWRDTHSTVTDEKGNFRLEYLDSGEYAVMVQDVGELDFDHVTLSLRDAPTGRADLTAKKQDFVRGVVRDEQKRPVAGATVQYTMPQMPLIYGSSRQGGMPSARTAGDGTFRLPLPGELPENMQISVQVFKRGYAIALSEPVTRDRRELTIILPTGVELSGSVVDTAGAPVAKAGIVVLQDPAGSVPLPIDSALASGVITPFIETDAEGKFSMRVNEKVHDVGAWKEGYAGARATNARPGDSPRIVLERGVEIRGRVTRKAGAPVASGMIVAGGEDASFARTTVESDGTFTLTGLRAGTYMLQFQDGSTSATAQVKAPATDIVIELASTGTVAGRVIDAETRKVLTRYDIMADTPGDMEVESVDGEESFSLDVPAGPVELTATAEGYVRGVEQTIVETGKTAEVTIALTPGRTAYGTVSDDEGKPVAKASLNVEDRPGFTQSDENGAFRLDGLPREAVTISVGATGLRGKAIELPAGSADARLDVVLERGRKASGRVVTSDGAPVEGATVRAMGEPMQETTTAADGRFTLSGLGAGPYMVYAAREELESDFAPLSDGETLLTMKPGAGAGSIHGVVEGFSEGQWMMGFVSAGDAHAPIGRDGKFRIERVRAGEIELRAWARSARGEGSTAPVRVTVIPNGDVEAKLAFRNDVQISGTVYEDGTPAPGRKVTFQGFEGRWSTVTNELGAYAIAGIEPGALYEVEVEHSGREFKTRYQVKGTATYDIRVEWSQVEGRVVDETGTPVAGAAVALVTDARDSAGETKTAANGAFMLPAARAAYVITIAKPGFATVTQRVEPGAAPLLVRMQRSGGLRVRITDARTGATLDGYAAALDTAGLQIAKSSDAQKDGAMLLPLAPGPYRIAVSADGYASQSARATVPHEGELRFALTPGGTLVVRSTRPTTDVVKLILASGEEYVRCQCNGIAEIRLTGLTTTIEHVAPGTYTMQVLDGQGLVKTTYPVTVTEGQTAIAELNVPE